MKLIRNKRQLKSENQKGVVLLVAMVLMIMFVLIGVVMAKKSKTGIEIAGSNTRYNMVFEATEKSLRNTILFMQNIKSGEPMTTTEVSRATQDLVADFGVSVAKQKDSLFVTNASDSFVWRPGSLEDKVCGASKCTSRVDFANRMDDNSLWQTYGIKSKLADAADVDDSNYLLNVRTYTFIQKISDTSTGATDSDGVIGGTGVNSETHYLITVRGSGYLPGEDLSDLHTLDVGKSRENVILQIVFVQRR